MRCMKVTLSAMALLPLVILVAHADAPATPQNKYHVTAKEKAACTEDAVRLCIQVYPDEDKLISCMRSNRSDLSESCRVVFDEGLKRRHM